MNRYLDLGPMLEAIRERPREFDVRGRYFRDCRNRHRFFFDSHGVVHVDAGSAGAELAIRPEQSEELKQAIHHWEETYWRPFLASKAAERRVAEINRAFTAHFRKSSRWWRWWDRIVSALRRRHAFSLDRIDPALPEDPDLIPNLNPRSARSRQHRSLLPPSSAVTASFHDGRRSQTRSKRA